MTSTPHKTDLRIAKSEALHMADELTARALTERPGSRVAALLEQAAAELRARIEAGWRTPSGLPMTYFQLDFSITPRRGGQADIKFRCG